MAIFPRSDGGPELAQKVIRTNTLVTEKLKGRRNVLRLDLRERFLNPDGSQNEALFRGGCHLSYAGYEVWGAALLPIFDRYVGPEPKE